MTLRSRCRRPQLLIFSTGPEPSSGIGNDITFDIDAWESLDGPPTTEDEGDTVVSDSETFEEDLRVDEESLPDIRHNVPQIPG
jgi:hypothetical protein